MLTGEPAALAAALANGGAAHLAHQSAVDGRTPLMHLIAASRLTDAVALLDRGDCNMNAQVRLA